MAASPHGPPRARLDVVFAECSEGLCATRSPGRPPPFVRDLRAVRRRNDQFTGTGRRATLQVQHNVAAGGVRFYHQAVQSNLKILVVEPEHTKAREIIDALKDGGWADVTVIGTPAALVRTMKALEPDIVLIDLANPDRDTLEHLSLVSDAKSRPVAMFVDQTDEAMTQAAISAGLSAYVVNGLQKDRIKPVLETAIARFNLFQKMQSELDAAKRALSDRKTIDRAKGLLMRAKGISEDDAYNLLRKTAMDQGRKVIDVATALVTAAELLQ